MVHVKFIEASSQKKTNRKRCLESKGPKARSGCWRKGEGSKCSKKGGGVPKRGEWA